MNFRIPFALMAAARKLHELHLLVNYRNSAESHFFYSRNFFLIYIFFPKMGILKHRVITRLYPNPFAVFKDNTLPPPQEGWSSR